MGENGENGKVRTVTDQNFAAEVVEAEGLSIVDFWAVWCGPCRMIAPIVEQLANDYADQGLRVGKLDVDQNPAIASHYGVRSIPTVLFLLRSSVCQIVTNFVFWYFPIRGRPYVG